MTARTLNDIQADRERLLKEQIDLSGKQTTLIEEMALKGDDDINLITQFGDLPRKMAVNAARLQNVNTEFEVALESVAVEAHAQYIKDIDAADAARAHARLERDAANEAAKAAQARYAHIENEYTALAMNRDGIPAVWKLANEYGYPGNLLAVRVKSQTDALNNTHRNRNVPAGIPQAAAVKPGEGGVSSIPLDVVTAIRKRSKGVKVGASELLAAIKGDS